MFGEISSGIVVVFMVVLAALLSRHYARKRRIHSLWWAVSFWLASLSAITDFFSYIQQDWTLWQYKVYLFSAATLVAYMGAGTVYLFSRRIGHIYVVIMTGIALVMAYVLINTPVPLLHHMPPGEKAQNFVPGAIVIYFALLSGIGAMALFAGAIYSFIRTRMAYNLWIALGALIFSIGGVVGTAVGVYELFYTFQALGSVVLYYGIALSVRSGTTQKGV